MALDGVEVRESGDGVRVIALDRPEQRNALDLELRVVFAEQIEAAIADPAVRAIVLTGNGGYFCAGGDTSSMGRRSEAESRPRLESAQRVVRAVLNAPQPVLAAVEGFAVGLGLGLALACDRVVAARDARFLTGFSRLGLTGDGGIYWSLPRRVGPARARQLLLLGTDVRGEEALALGLVDVLAEPGAALADALRDAQKLAAGPPLALRAIKALTYDLPPTAEAALAAEIEANVRMFDTADFEEGLTAMREKRPARFTGA